MKKQGFMEYNPQDAMFNIDNSFLSQHIILILTSKDLNPIASWTLVGTKLNLHTTMLLEGEWRNTREENHCWKQN
jgi:hypothetical protein